MTISTTHAMPALPPIGTVPATMLAQVVRRERFGDPATAFAIEKVAVPELGPLDVLVGVMAAGVNYNNVWAARGIPVDVIGMRQRAGEPFDYHVGGSDASGIVYAVGSAVSDVAIGDEVIVHPGCWDAEDPFIARGGDPMIAPSARIWGYDTNFGAFAQFARVQAHQVLPKADHLSWAEAAAPTLVGTTAYRMLFGWAGNELRKEDVALIWGGSGGLGTQAIQLAKHVGAIPVAVVGSESKGAACIDLGAAGFINRNDFSHWGVPPHWTDGPGQKEWTAEARRFGKAIWDVIGEKRSPNVVFEHPGEDTVPTSIFVCEPGGMVVICAGTTGYSATVDLRYHWTRQKRLQGSHGTNDDQARAFNDLVRDGVLNPCVGEVATFDQVGRVHADMAAGTLPPGNTVVLVNADSAESGRRG